MNVLVTGGAGFIGSHVADWLVDAKHEVYVLDDLSGGFQENLNNRVTFISGSINDGSLVDRVIEHYKIDLIYHLAAYAAEGLSHFIRNFNYTNNLLGSMNLINSAIRHDVKCFVFTSSIAVYGSAQNPMKEDMVPRPEDPYGISKYAIELDLEAAQKMFGLNYIIFRPHNVYGERQNTGDPYRNVIGLFMNQIMQNQPCTIFGDGTQTRAFTHVSDVAPIIGKAPFWKEAYNQTFNIGFATPYSINILLKRVQIAMGKNTGVVHLPARKEVLHAWSDSAKCKKILGGCAEVTLINGLQRMADWARRAGVRKGKPFADIEIHKCLPESWRKLC
jgi:UDP-glucose 4-epimerase